MTSTLILLAALVVLGVTRATGLVMNDKITEQPRKQIVDRGGYWAYSIGCPWCTSLQLALVTVYVIGVPLAVWYRPPVVLWPVCVAVALCTAGAVSLLAVMLDRLIDRTPTFSDDPDEARRLTRGPDPTVAPPEQPPIGVAAAFRASRSDRPG